MDVRTSVVPHVPPAFLGFQKVLIDSSQMACQCQVIPFQGTRWRLSPLLPARDKKASPGWHAVRSSARGPIVPDTVLPTTVPCTVLLPSKLVRGFQGRAILAEFSATVHPDWLSGDFQTRPVCPGDQSSKGCQGRDSNCTEYS